MIGLGSIGQRHVRNIRKLYGSNVELIAYRVRGLSQLFSDDMQVRDNVSLEQEYDITSFSNLQDALSLNPKVAFITNITANHIECAIQAANAGCDLFIEKPLSHSMSGVKNLKAIIDEKHLLAYMGFQNRYHPCLKLLKYYVDNFILGKIISVDIEMGERITTMHKYENYAETYMSQKIMGGGVVLSQQIHEIDYMNWIFGFPYSIYSIGGKSSDFQIDVEDNVSSIYLIKKDTFCFPVYIHSDFVQYPPTRKCKVICEKGYMIADLNLNIFSWTENDQIYQKTFDKFSRNDMFLDEIKDFFECVSSREIPKISINDGINSLQIALATLNSMKKKLVITINSFNNDRY